VWSRLTGISCEQQASPCYFVKVLLGTTGLLWFGLNELIYCESSRGAHGASKRSRAPQTTPKWVQKPSKNPLSLMLCFFNKGCKGDVMLCRRLTTALQNWSRPVVRLLLGWMWAPWPTVSADAVPNWPSTFSLISWKLPSGGTGHKKSRLNCWRYSAIAHSAPRLNACHLLHLSKSVVNKLEASKSNFFIWCWSP